MSAGHAPHAFSWNAPSKVYLGDSVYCAVEDANLLRLTTENGDPGDPRNVIFLERAVYVALVVYARRSGFEEQAMRDHIAQEAPVARDARGPCSGAVEPER
jgi:hypothetical protein